MFKLEDIKAGYLLVVEFNGKELFNMTVQYDCFDTLGVCGESKNSNHYFPLGEFDTRLETKGGYENFKITKIYGRTANRFLLANDIKDRKLLWQRQGTKEMTLEEIIEALGYDVKVVK